MIKKTKVIVATLVITLTTAACSLPEEPAEAPLVKSSAADVNKVLADEVFSADLTQLSAGQMVKYEHNYRAEIDGVVKYLDVIRQVRTAEWNQVEDTLLLKLVMDHGEQEFDLSGKPSEPVFKEVIHKLEFNTVANAMTMFAAPFMFSPREDEEPVETIEYYNLEAQRVLVPAPKDTAEKSGCGGLENCKIRAMQVDFIMVLKKDGKISQKFKRSVTVSREIPPLFFFDDTNGILPVYSDCFTSLYAGAIYLNQCTVLRDIQK